MENKKNIIIGILIFLLLGVVGICIYLVVDKSSGVGNEQKEEIKENIEKDITDSILKDELSSKINLLYDGYGTKYEFVTKEYKSSNIDKNEKLLIALNSTYNNGIKKINEFTGEIELEKVKDRYYAIFGEELINYEVDTTKNVIKGYQWKYDNNSNKYIVNFYGSGNSAGKKILTYNNRYTIDNNTAYVYVSCGYQYGDENNNIYLYNEYKEDMTGIHPYSKEQVNNYQDILEKNYKDFSEYKVTFKKNNSGYHFYSIEKLNSGKIIESEKSKIKNNLESIYKDLINGKPRADVGMDKDNANFKTVSENMEYFEVVDIKKRTNTCATTDDYQITFKYKCKNDSYDCIYVEQIGAEQKLDNNYYQLTQYFEVDGNYNVTKFKGNGMTSFNPNCKIEIIDID